MPIAASFGHDVGNLRFIQGMKNRELLAFSFVGNAGDGKDLSVEIPGLVQGFLHFAMRHHLTADF